MPMKAKAEDHSQLVRTTTHHDWNKESHHNFHLNNWKKVLIVLGVLLVIAFIAWALSTQVGSGLGA